MPGRAETACLALQEQGADVCLLLVAAWLGRRGVSCSKERAQILENAARPWRETVIEPLRRLRCAWREAATHDACLAELREEMKAQELSGTGTPATPGRPGHSLAGGPGSESQCGCLAASLQPGHLHGSRAPGFAGAWLGGLQTAPGEALVGAAPLLPAAGVAEAALEAAAGALGVAAGFAAGAVAGLVAAGFAATGFAAGLAAGFAAGFAAGLAAGFAAADFATGLAAGFAAGFAAGCGLRALRFSPRAWPSVSRQASPPAWRRASRLRFRRRLGRRFRHRLRRRLGRASRLRFRRGLGRRFRSRLRRRLCRASLPRFRRRLGRRFRSRLRSRLGRRLRRYGFHRRLGCRLRSRFGRGVSPCGSPEPCQQPSPCRHPAPA